MRPDSSIDYYAVLGVQPSASEDEIKKAYRKQALLHHPDRNPGKEEEAKARFQNVQIAHDILADKTKRDKYDRDRLKNDSLGHRPASTSATANHSQPQTPFPQPQARPPPPPKTATTGHGAARYAGFQDSSKHSYFGSNVNAKFQAFKAFENMKGQAKQEKSKNTSPPKPRAAPTAQRPRARSDWDEGQYSRENPRVSRSQSTRSPRKAGFDPYSDAGDEPASRRASAYYNVSRGGTPQASRPVPGQRSRMSFAEASPSNNRPGYATPSDDDVSGQRFRASYTAKSGERTYFPSPNSSAYPNLGVSASDVGSNKPAASPAASKHRSASPATRSPFPGSPSSSEEDAFKTMKNDWRPRNARHEGGGSRTHRPKATVADETDEPVVFEDLSTHRPQHSDPPNRNDRSTTQSKPNPQISGVDGSLNTLLYQQSNRAATSKTDRASEASKRPSLYDELIFPFAKSCNECEAALKSDAMNVPERSSTFAWPYWAVPSSVAPKNLARANKSDGLSCVYPPEFFLSEGVPTSSSYVNDAYHLDRFSMPNNSSGSSLPRNPSAENVDTQFSPTSLPPTFTGSTDYIRPQPVQGGAVWGKTSPPKHAMPRPEQASPPKSAPDQESIHAPTPQNPFTSRMPAEPSRTKFSPKEWEEHFRGATWAMPPPPPPATNRPMQTPRSRNSKRNAQPKRRPSTSEAQGSAPFDDTGEEADDESRQSGSNIDTDPDMSRTASGNAMDIDETPLQPNGAVQIPISPTAQTTTSFPKPPPPTMRGFNMQALARTFPFAETSGSGLSGISQDLKSTLPFKPAATEEVGEPPKARKLPLPDPPKQPLPPGRLTQQSYETYMRQVSAYMREFHVFNRRMIEHFGARQVNMEEMTQSVARTAEKGFLPMANGSGGGGFAQSGASPPSGLSGSDMAAWSWMGARGDDGFLTYVAWMEEDERVRDHWDAAWEKHKLALEKLGNVRKKMKDLLSRSAVP